MATAALKTSAVDLRAQNSHTIRLGKSILSPDDVTRWTSVRYNHKPSLKSGKDVSATILPGQDAGTSKAELRDEDNEWKYEGTHSQAEETYVLVLSKDEAVLERVRDVYAYNLTQTPDESNATKLARKYSHIPASRSAGDNDNEKADPRNPFDFRHFLKTAEAKRNEAIAKSTAGTPLLQSRAAISTPSILKPRPAPTSAVKRKAPASKTAAAFKRVKAAHDPPLPRSSTQAKAVPSVRLDRKASIHHPPATASANDEDDGELILENSNTTKSSSMHLALSGAFAQPSPGTGPISLRSAASSPGGRVESPAPASQQQEGQQVYEFDMGSDDEAEEGDDGAGISHEFEFDNSDDEDAAGEADGGVEDGDVEELELPSPVQENHAPQQQRNNVSGAGAGGVEEEDDMEAQLALAFEAELAAPAVVEESDEDVSEEE